MTQVKRITVNNAKDKSSHVLTVSGMDCTCVHEGTEDESSFCRNIREDWQNAFFRESDTRIPREMRELFIKSFKEVMGEFIVRQARGESPSLEFSGS